MKELVYKVLQEFDSYKSLGPDNIHLMVSRKLADIAARLLSIIFEKSWRSRKTGSLMSTPSTTRAKRRIQKITGLPVLTFWSWESYGTSPPGTITSQMKHMTGKSHNILGKMYVTNLMVFNDRVICSVEVGWVVDIVNLHFDKALNTASHSFFLENLMCYSQDESAWLMGNWLAGPEPW